MPFSPLVTVDASACSVVAVCRCGWRAVHPDLAGARAAETRHLIATHPDAAEKRRRRGTLDLVGAR